jgi:KDO2-lipid IV(A) lauroyltransferase
MATVAAGEIGAGRLLPSPRRAVSEWARRGEHLGLLLAAATSLTSALPTALRYGLADIGGEGAYWLLRPRSRLAEENYRIFASSPSEARRLTRRAFRNYARTVMDFLVLESLVRATGEAQEMVESGPLRRVLATHRTAIVVTPHFGNWDLGAAMTAAAGRPVFAVADRFGPPAVDRRVRAMRERVGVTVIPSGPTSGREALRVLRRGDVLCLAADIDHTGSGVAVTFFGRRVTFPAGPATLALHTESPIIPGFVRRWPRGRHEARLLDPLPWPPPASSGERVQALTQQIASAFERIIGQEPSQWFAFHRLPAAVPGGGR